MVTASIQLLKPVSACGDLACQGHRSVDLFSPALLDPDDPGVLTQRDVARGLPAHDPRVRHHPQP
jgi:hypothetical protein